MYLKNIFILKIEKYLHQNLLDYEPHTVPELAAMANYIKITTKSNKNGY